MYRLRSLLLAALLASSLFTPAFACAYYHAHTAPSVNRFSLAEADEDLVVSPACILPAGGSGAVISDFPEAPAWSADMQGARQDMAHAATPGSFNDAAPAYYDTASGSDGRERSRKHGSIASPSDMEV